LWAADYKEIAAGLFKNTEKPCCRYNLWNCNGKRKVDGMDGALAGKYVMR
jgi:hypothetical protein